VAPRLDGNSVWIRGDHLLEAIRNRLRDLFLFEFNERSRWMKTLRPNSLL
jgi:hypothetical protein